MQKENFKCYLLGKMYSSFHM